MAATEEALEVIERLRAAPALTDRFLAAVALGNEVHGHARRLGTEIPYYGRLLASFEERRRGPLVDDLRHAVGELAELVAADPAFAGR